MQYTPKEKPGARNKKNRGQKQPKIALRRNYEQQFTHPGRIAGRNPPHLQQQQAQTSHDTIRQTPHRWQEN
jgi:hypothetical protein